jgi:di/tricarboxylate transporter
MTSHAARAAALIPPLLYLAGPIGLDAVAVMFIATVGMNYCLTFPVSSKALIVFHEIDDGFHRTDLLRLSAILIIVHIVLIVAFYYGYWQWVGLAL